MSLNTWDSGRARRPPKSRKREPRNSAMRPVPSGCVAFSIRTGYGARVTALRRAGNSLLRACILAAMDAARILVVDDDRVVREMLAQYLSEHGYQVALAEGGDAMRAELERAVPAVVLLDVRMPGKDGLTLARYVREHYDVGIIMVTAAGDVVDRVAGLEVGADDYIAKPFDLRELRARLKSVLRRLETRASPGAPAAPLPQR